MLCAAPSPIRYDLSITAAAELLLFGIAWLRAAWGIVGLGGGLEDRLIAWVLGGVGESPSLWRLDRPTAAARTECIAALSEAFGRPDP